MATEVVKTVDTGGTGDYTSLTAWEAGEQKDLVTADEIAVAKCQCTTGAADTSLTTIDGWTTDSTHYIKIWTDPTESYRHDGKWNTSAYRIEVSSQWGVLLRIMEPYVRIYGLQVYNTWNSTGEPRGIQLDNDANSGGEIHIAYNLIRFGPTSDSRKVGIYTYAGFNGTEWLKVWNNIFYDCYAAMHMGIWSGVMGNVVFYNNTVCDCTDYGFYLALEAAATGDKTLYLKNNLIQGTMTNYYFYGAANLSTYDHTNNISEDATSPDLAYQNKVVTFVDEANDDFHLDSTDTNAKDQGVDLSGDTILAFSDDIDGENRSGTWDIGADEYVTTGGQTYEDSITLSSVLAQTQNRVAQVVANITLQQINSMIQSALAQMEAVLNLTKSLTQSQNAIIATFAEVALNEILTQTQDTVAQYNTEISLSSQLSQSQSASATAEAQAVLSKQLQILQQATANAVAALEMNLNLIQQQLSGHIYIADISLVLRETIELISALGAIKEVAIVTVPNIYRTLKVQPESRELLVQLEDRIIKILDKLRKINIQ